MRRIREVLRLKHECALPNAQIAAALGIAKGSVANYLAAATAAGLTHSEAQALDDAALNVRLHPQRYVYPQFAVPDFGEIHRELRRKGVTPSTCRRRIARIGSGPQPDCCTGRERSASPPGTWSPTCSNPNRIPSKATGPASACSRWRASTAMPGSKPAACAPCALGAKTRKSVASILAAGLDRQPTTATLFADAVLPSHANVRGPEYYH